MNEKVILLVEDNPDDEVLTVKALREYIVVVAHDGKEAFDFLYGTGDYRGRDMSLPVLVLLDLKLPQIGGFQVLRRIKTDRRTRTLPVIICSSSGDESDIAESYSLGANSYILKPVEYAEYQEKLKTTMRYWLGLNALPSPRA